MKRFLSMLLVNSLSFYILDLLFDKIMIGDWKTIIALGLVFAIVNAVVKPILKVLSLPITILTLGIFALVINALVLMLAFKLVPSASIAGFGTAFWASIVLSIVNSVLTNLID